MDRYINLKYITTKKSWSQHFLAAGHRSPRPRAGGRGAGGTPASQEPWAGGTDIHLYYILFVMLFYIYIYIYTYFWVVGGGEWLFLHKAKIFEIDRLRIQACFFV